MVERKQKEKKLLDKLIRRASKRIRVARSMRFDPLLLKEFEQFCDRHNLNMASVLEVLIEELLNDN